MTWCCVVRVVEFIDNSTRVTDSQLCEFVEGLYSREQFVSGGNSQKTWKKIMYWAKLYQERIYR